MSVRNVRGAAVPWGEALKAATIRSGSGYGSGLSRTLLTTEKTAWPALMPSVSAAIAVIV
jgi:hypothetical protein